MSYGYSYTDANRGNFVSLDNEYQHRTLFLFPKDLEERYHDASLIGRGGMGHVFRAHDTRLARDVAIKVLPYRGSSPNAVIRFQQEAKAVSKLNQRNVVQVMDFGFTAGGEPFLVMEFIKGEELTAVLTREGTLSVEKAIQIAVQLCAALDHAHAQGVVHRDLKPGNIMIDSNNTVRILDFGLARMIDETDADWRLTKPGQPVGTFLYMSPEQIRGEETDVRTDVYALGVVIYKMVSGVVPFESSNVVNVMRRRQSEPPLALPPSEDKFRDKLDAVLQKALALKPEDRFANMTSFKDALNNCLLETTGGSTSLGESKKSIRLGTIIGITVSAIVVVAVCYAGMRSNQPTPAPKKKPDPIEAHVVPVRTNAADAATAVLPRGFYREDDTSAQYWVAREEVDDEALKRLLGTPVIYLSLQGNKFVTSKGIKTISQLPIEALSLRDTKIGDDSMPYICSMNSLFSVGLRHCALTDAGVMKMKPMRHLESLDFKYLQLKDSAIKHVVDTYPKLQSLNVGESQVTARGIREVLRLKELRALYMEGLKLEDKDVEKIIAMPSLQRIELAANKITDKSIDALIKRKDLEWASLQACESVSTEAIGRLKTRFPKAEILERDATKPPPELYDMFDKYTEDEASEEYKFEP